MALKNEVKIILQKIIIVSLILVFNTILIYSKDYPNKLIVNVDIEKGKISRYIYGHFAEHLGRCIYDGLWVGESSNVPNIGGVRKDIIEALKKIKAPVIRWPGGCFADTYHWMDGIGPRELRPPMINIFWGEVIEDNHFGTHEFLNFCEEVGCDAYISGNVGSGTVKELADWVEYVNFDGNSPMANLRRKNGREKPWNVKFWGIGNENWGCGGNMTAEYYVDLLKRFATYVRDYGVGITRIACGPNSSNYHWMETIMRDGRARKSIQAVSLHYYTVFESWSNKGSATDFTEYHWFGILERTLRMDDIIKRHSAIMDRYDPDRRIGLMVDEWGTWYNVEPGTNPSFLYQQNTIRDAIVAGINLNIFNNHCERVKMANIAQLVNVLQALFLTKGDKMILTPTYHVFDMYKIHQDATSLLNELSCEEYTYDGKSIPSLNSSASKDDNGLIHITLCNLDPKNKKELLIELRGVKSVKEVSGKVLTAKEMNSHNTFDNPDNVKPTVFRDFKVKNNTVVVDVPSKSVIVLEIKR